MSSTSARRRTPGSRRERGFVLVTGLLFLVILTLLGLALFRSTGLLDRISANTRDKERSFEVAQGALQYGEWLLASGKGGTGGNCAAGIVNGNVATNVKVCTNALTNPTTLPWPRGFSYTAPNVTVATGGGMAATGADVNYNAAPTLYIERLGLAANGKSQVYQVTAAGYGGSAETGTVVRSTYQVTPSVQPLDGL